MNHEYRPQYGIFSYLERRSRLILNNEGITLKGFLPFFDKDIKYNEISDVIKDGSTLQILKRGVSPSISGETADEYMPYISTFPLENAEEVYQLIKERI
jgi:hypothetical protein